jgi:deoxycytidylate deaminase
MNLVVTEHAIDRWCERVDNRRRDQVVAAIHAAEGAIAHAAAFGACAVKLGNGARLICVHEPHETRVVTVIGRHQRLTRHAFGEPAV